jgi:excisionase family DNA binding protein
MTGKKFTPEEVASLSGLAVTTVLTWIRAKKLKAKRTRGYQIAASDVRTFLLAQAASKQSTVN